MPITVLFIVGTWSLHVLWHGGLPMGSGREWTLYQGLELHTCERMAQQVTGPIERIWCERTKQKEKVNDEHRLL